MDVLLGLLVGFADAGGRSAECATRECLIADARQGHSQVLLVRCELGMGKSAQLDHAIHHAQGCAMVQA